MTGPRRIAMISHYLPSDSKMGVGYWVHELASALTDRGHAVTVFSACPAVDGATYVTETVPLRGSLRTFQFALKMRKIDFSSFDVLHAHGDDYWLWRRRVGAHIRTMHGSCFSEALRIHGAWERLRMVALGLGETMTTLVADETFCISPATRRWMPWVRNVVPDGVDLDRFRPGRTREAVPTILFVGTYERRKRGRLLMEVFQDEIRPALPDAQLWMVCDDAPAAAGVSVLGKLSGEELVDRYQRAWAFCLPSSYEGLGIPYIEALACGTPVVATPNAGSRYVLDEGRYGIITPTTSLGSALTRLLQDDRSRSQWSARAMERRGVFGLDSTVDEYEAVYERLLSRASAWSGGRSRA